MASFLSYSFFTVDGLDINHDFSLSNYKELINFIRSKNFSANIIDTKKLFYEKLIIVEVKSPV